MKKYIVLTFSVILSLSAWAQNSEAALNRKYNTAVRSELESQLKTTSKQMQKRAQQWLVALPNDEKLSNETYINIDTRLSDTIDEEGTPELNMVFEISYNSRELVSMLDDYPVGCYQWNSSNSARAICELTRMFVDGELKSLFRSGAHVDVEVMSRADSIEIVKPLPYGGEYGDFRYMPANYNDSVIRLSVSQKSGIAHNVELAYIRAQSVRSMLDSAVNALQNTTNRYSYTVRTRAPFRRSSVRITVHDPYRAYIDQRISEMRQDEYVDYNIPTNEGREAQDTYVLIIANEHSDNAFMPDATYAANDAEMMRQYFVKTIGVPARQVKVLNNAARHTIMEEGVHWLTDLAKAVTRHDANGSPIPTANFFVYFSGYGFRDYNEVAYLIPNNVNADEIKSLQATSAKSGCKLFGKKKKNAKAQSTEARTYDVVLSRKEAAQFASQCIGVEELCNIFSSKEFPLNSLTVIIDAGFDGHQRNGGLMVRSNLASDNGKRKRRANLRSDVVVLLAADYDKTAYSFDDQHHGFLTYFLLSEVRANAASLDRLTYQDIYEAIERRLSKESALQGKLQEPTGMAGGKFKEDWKDLRL